MINFQNFVCRLTICVTLLFCMTVSALAAVPPHPSEADWQSAFGKFKAPYIIYKNDTALRTRLLMLDYAPSGSEVAILAFVFDNGETTRALAAHVCKAAQRGVKVRWLTDSKSGSVPGRKNLFEHSASEELFQYMANCGSNVRIHNHIGIIRKVAGVVFPAKKYIWPGKKSLLPQAAVNRLNHRKLFWVRTPGGQACFLLGGRNLGDHYLAWHTGGDSFIDSDIMICNHFQQDPVELPYARTDEFNKVTQQALASFDSLWNDEENGSNGDLEWTAPVEVFKLAENHEFKFKHIYLASVNEKGVKRPEAEFNLGKGLESKENKDAKIGEVPVAHVVNSNVPQGRRFKLSYDWDIKTSMWNPKYDQVRDALHDMVRREQAELFIESAYMEYDKELQKLIWEALDRGVRVMVITNSIYSSDAASKLISLTRAAFTNDLLNSYGRNFKMEFNAYYNMPRQNHQDPTQEGRFEFYVTTGYTGHMIHFKGAGAKCQKGDDGQYYKSFILGSHNFHVRSGLADKEHALTWKEPVDLTCYYRLGFTEEAASQAEAQKIGMNYEEITSRYVYATHERRKDVGFFVRPKPQFRDLIDQRLRYWSNLNYKFTKVNNKPILLAFPSLRSEIESMHDMYAQGKDTSKLQKAFTWMKDRSYDDYDPAKISQLKPGPKKILNLLSPFRDFASKFL